jgi:hypothetical protein
MVFLVSTEVFFFYKSLLLGDALALAPMVFLLFRVLLPGDCEPYLSIFYLVGDFVVLALLRAFTSSIFSSSVLNEELSLSGTRSDWSGDVLVPIFEVF